MLGVVFVGDLHLGDRGRDTLDLQLALRSCPKKPTKQKTPQTAEKLLM